MTGTVPNPPARILIVDDDARIREVIRFALEDAAMAVVEAGNGQEAVDACRTEPPDFIVLDVGMPEMDGFEACRAIRKTSDVPILFLTARDDEIDRVLGFELGGDDYLSKPFSPRELILRIRAILKRHTPEPAPAALRHADLEMIPDEFLCRLGDTPVALTRIEFSLLLTLANAPERVLSRNQLIDAIYGHNTYLSDRTVDSHIRNIRQKAAANGCPDVIQTVHGVGVKLGQCRVTP